MKENYHVTNFYFIPYLIYLRCCVTIASGLPSPKNKKTKLIWGVNHVQITAIYNSSWKTTQRNSKRRLQWPLSICRTYSILQFPHNSFKYFAYNNFVSLFSALNFMHSYNRYNKFQLCSSLGKPRWGNGRWINRFFLIFFYGSWSHEAWRAWRLWIIIVVLSDSKLNRTF